MTREEIYEAALELGYTDLKKLIKQLIAEQDERRAMVQKKRENVNLEAG